MENYSAKQRFEALAYFFGWQGGTIHQLQQAMECDNIFNRDLNINEYNLNTDYYQGFSSVRTCSVDFRNNTITPKYLGNWEFWSGVIRGYWITGALGGKEFSERFGN